VPPRDSPPEGVPGVLSLWLICEKSLRGEAPGVPIITDFMFDLSLNNNGVLLGETVNVLIFCGDLCVRKLNGLAVRRSNIGVDVVVVVVVVDDELFSMSIRSLCFRELSSEYLISFSQRKGSISAKNTVL